MKTFLLTVRYFPFPQPTSKPTDPGGSFFRKSSTTGHGYSKNGKIVNAYSWKGILLLISFMEGEDPSLKKTREKRKQTLYLVDEK
jgi:hypothetical protein